MKISEADVKRLWGRAAGRCSYPMCDEELLKYVDAKSPTILGEMAHIIARRADGPRGSTVGEEDNSYANLILLCPTHHTLIDKAPAEFPPAMLSEWKAQHEERVATSLNAPSFTNKNDLYAFGQKRLAENRLIHQNVGPDSALAKNNPLTSGADLWIFRKLMMIIPNNRKIINAFMRNEALIPPEDWLIFVKFREHAEAFERSAYERLDDDVVPRFPIEFAKIMSTA